MERKENCPDHHMEGNDQLASRKDTQRTKVCMSFLKSATCPSGDSCNLRHDIHGQNVTVLLPNFFQHPALFSEDPLIVENITVEELEEEYGKFYCDVIWRFRTIAPVLMFKCLRNTAKHLCGNVYVQYANSQQASTAAATFNSALSEQYNVEAQLCHLTDWKSAICGKESCPMGLGSSCDYLHVFVNPGNEYRGRFSLRPDGYRWNNVDNNNNILKDRSCSRSSLKNSRKNIFNKMRRPPQEAKPKQPCITYNKTGACVFGEGLCQLTHRSLAGATTVLVPNMFEYVFARHDEHDLATFSQFYHNTLAWFSCMGTVVMYKCCKNLASHLKGNLYVQFENHEQAVQAVNEYNGCDYDGKPIEVKLCPVTNWKGAICRSSPCLLGISHCIDLHVYRNPGNEFSVSRWD